MKRLFSYIFTFAAIAGALTLSSCRRTPNPATIGELKVICDESVENVIRQEVEVFELKYPATKIKAQYTDKKTAIDSLLNLSVGVIVVPHELTQDQINYLKSQKRNAFCMPVAVDAIAVIANRQNPIEDLSMAQLSDILTGKVTDWNQISPNKTGEIDVVFDHQGSSTVEYMLKNVTGGKPFGKNIYAQKTNTEVFKAVKTHKGAIGIIGVSWLNRDLTDLAKVNNYSKEEVEKIDNASVINHEISSSYLENDSLSFQSDVKVVAIRKNDSPYAFKPYQQDIYTGDYPLFRTIYAICTGSNGSPQHGFYVFLLSILGQKVILNTGVLPANMPPARSVAIQQDEY